MSIKLDTPIAIPRMAPVNQDSVDLYVYEFKVGRDSVNSINVEVRYGLGEWSTDPDIFTPWKMVTKIVSGSQARNFLRRQVSGRLGVIIESEVLDALESAGDIGSGTVIEEDE